MATVTRSALRQAAADLIGALLWTGTASGGSTTSLVDTGDGGLRDTGYSSTLFVGAYVLITGNGSGLGSGNNAGLWRQVTPTGFDETTGTLTFGEPFGTAIASGDTYEIYLDLDPSQWNTIIDQALAKLRYEYRGPITLITDGDMETSGVTNWTATSTVRAKETSGGFIIGTQALSITNSGANGYVQSASVDCNPGDGFTLWADYRSLTGTARLRAWDVTNGATIQNSTGDDGGDNREGGMITFGFNAPSTARQIAARLIGDEATAVIWWEDVILLRSGRRRYPLPSWIAERDQLVHIEERWGNRPQEYQWVPISQPPVVVEDQTGVTPLQIILPDGLGGRPIYAHGWRAYSSLATDATTTNCPVVWAKHAIAVEALRRYAHAFENTSLARIQVDKDEIIREFNRQSAIRAPRESWPAVAPIQWVTSGGRRW